METERDEIDRKDTGFRILYTLLFWVIAGVVEMVVGAIAVVDRAPVGPLNRWSVHARRLGAASLTVFMLETPLSQVLVRIGDALSPGWRLTIGPCLAFGALNALLWVAIVTMWARWQFRYSMEWLTVRVHALLGRPSDKLEAHERLG